MFVNPLADADLSAPVPPGHILVDLTYATSEDLQALGPTLAEVQRRLRYQKRAGGRPRHGTRGRNRSSASGCHKQPWTSRHDTGANPTRRSLPPKSGSAGRR